MFLFSTGIRIFLSSKYVSTEEETISQLGITNVLVYSKNYIRDDHYSMHFNNDGRLNETVHLGVFVKRYLGH